MFVPVLLVVWGERSQMYRQSLIRPFDQPFALKSMGLVLVLRTTSSIQTVFNTLLSTFLVWSLWTSSSTPNWQNIPFTSLLAVVVVDWLGTTLASGHGNAVHGYKYEPVAHLSLGERTRLMGAHTWYCCNGAWECPVGPLWPIQVSQAYTYRSSPVRILSEAVDGICVPKVACPFKGMDPWSPVSAQGGHPGRQHTCCRGLWS